MAITVLTNAPLIPWLETWLDETYEVIRLHQADDPATVLAERAGDIRAVVSGAVDAALIEALPGLEIIAIPGVGHDGIDLGAAKHREIRVGNTADVLNDAVAELAIGLMIALARRIPQADVYVREGRWAAEGNYPLTGELTGSTVGIIGLGRIGKEIAARCLAMKMRVIYHGRTRQDHVPYVHYDKLGDMARDANWLVNVAPGGAGTEKLISRPVLEALGPEGCLVNLGRGTTVDEAAMIELLQSGGLGGAALDVFEDEPDVPDLLRTLDNVVLSPHQGSATVKTRRAMGWRVMENLAAHFEGRPLLSSVL
ncbi:2-hydroxyacid dehydrogenase [Cucumibacter marinus]|uniref:2-hydroxyacid dehydrogenase n=1 Tax=Cucumibacter marinus TaxID=1121252 RepID=UPI0004084F11|nr:2-hydroxyacid dehydrogenase [Cucumibacter marinus]